MTRSSGGTISVGVASSSEPRASGRDTQLAHMLRLVEDAQNEKASVQRLADRISSVIRPDRASRSRRHLARLAAGRGLDRACVQRRHLGSDHRLPLRPRARDPNGASRRVRARGPPRDLLQGIPGTRGVAAVDTVVLDKTGTVTTGKMTVTDIRRGIGRSTVALFCGWPERSSRHPSTWSQGPSRRSPAKSSVPCRRSRGSWHCRSRRVRHRRRSRDLIGRAQFVAASDRCHPGRPE